MKFGDRLRELRKEKNLSQRELADKVHINFTYLSKLENNKMPPPSQKTIVELAKALYANEEELILLAKKVPNSFKSMITEKAHVPEFLRTARNHNLSEEEWKGLIKLIKERKKKK